jgi:hypothetical protein
MTSRRHRVIVAASLYNVGDRSAIDLQIKNYIPSKDRTPQNDKTPTRLSGGGSDRGCANKNKDQKESGNGGKSGVHGPMLASGLVFSQPGVNQLPDLSSSFVMQFGKTFRTSQARHFALLRSFARRAGEGQIALVKV